MRAGAKLDEQESYGILTRNSLIFLWMSIYIFLICGSCLFVGEIVKSQLKKAPH